MGWFHAQRGAASARALPLGRPARGGEGTRVLGRSTNAGRFGRRDRSSPHG